VFNARKALKSFLTFLNCKFDISASLCVHYESKSSDGVLVCKAIADNFKAFLDNDSVHFLNHFVEQSLLIKNNDSETAGFVEVENGIFVLEVVPGTYYAIFVAKDAEKLSEWMLGKNIGYLQAFLYSLLEKIAASNTTTSGRVTDKDIDQILNDITDVFEDTLLKRWLKKPDEDLWDTVGKSRFQEGLARYVSRNQPILFVLSAFPFKSSNRVTKVIGECPDMGEKLALRRLDGFLLAIKKIYEPGGRLVLFGDGRVYCDLSQVSDDTASDYRTTIREIHPSPYIHWADLDIFFPTMTHVEKREALEAIFGTTYENLDFHIKTKSDFLELYCGFGKFMTEELTLPEEWGNRRRKRQIDAVAKHMVMRNWAYAAMVKSLFPEHVRLSIHPSSNTFKFGVSLVTMSDWGTPWHNCALLRTDGTWVLIRRKQAIEEGHELTSTNGLMHYVEKL